MDLNYIFESYVDLDDKTIKKMSFDERINLMAEHVFNFDYPIDDKYKKEFERSFLSYFWFYEISAESYTRWHFMLQRMLIKGGKRYNNIYKAQLDDIDEAINMMDIETSSEAEGLNDVDAHSKAETESNSESGTLNRGTDIPQGRVDIDKNYFNAMNDAKQHSKGTGLTNENQNQKTTSKNKGKSTTKGYSGMPKAQLHRMYVENMISANEIIMYDFNALFLQVM